MPRANEPIRVLTAVPICDGHDSAINTINLELIRHGVEVIYLGYHRSARDIARAAVQEDVRGVGISSYNGGHVEFFAKVVEAYQHLTERAGARQVDGARCYLTFNMGGSVTTNVTMIWGHAR